MEVFVAGYIATKCYSLHDYQIRYAARMVNEFTVYKIERFTITGIGTVITNIVTERDLEILIYRLTSIPDLTLS